MLDRFAEELKQLRLDKNLTLLQVAQYTRIDIKFLESIEEGDFSFQPELYIKAFIKDYIKALDEDPVLYLKKYDAAKQGKLYEEPKVQEPVKKSHTPFRSGDKKTEPKIEESTSPIPFNHEEEREEEKEQSKNYIETPIEYPETPKPEPPKTTVRRTSFNAVSTGPAPIEYNPGGIDRQWIIIGGIGICFVLVLAIYFLFFKGDSHKIVTENSYQQEVTENSNRYTEPVSTPSDNNAVTTSDSISLEIKCSEKAWLSLKQDSASAKDMALNPNEPVKVSAKYFFTLFTNKAKSMTLNLNGRALEFSPGSNRAKFQVNKDGVTNIKLLSKSDNSSNVQ